MLTPGGVTIGAESGRKKTSAENRKSGSEKKCSGVQQKTSLWEASGDLETPRRSRETKNQKMTDAVLARKLQQEERRKSERLASLPLLVERKSKKIGLSQACILLPLSRLDEKEREQLQKVWPLSQAYQMKQEQEDKRASMALSDLTDIGTEVEVKTEVEVENNDCRDEKVKEEELAQVKENSETHI